MGSVLTSFVSVDERRSKLSLRGDKDKGTKLPRKRSSSKKNRTKKAEHRKEKERDKEGDKELPEVKVEGTWLDDTQKLAAYSELYQSEVCPPCSRPSCADSYFPKDVLELKMKMVGVRVKLLSQDASKFMQLDPNEKLETILRYLSLNASLFARH